MLLNTSLLATGLLALGITAAPLEDRQATSYPDGFSLSIPATTTDFDINYLQSLRLSYANSSAYLGAIKYQTYSEPLVVSGANIAPASGDGLSFLSIHSSPTGYQQMYVVPHQSAPVGFSVPHGGSPQGVRTTGFGFGPAGNLRNNGRKLFYACQDAELAALQSYQVWWLGGKGVPQGWTCKGPLNLRVSDGCARSG